jgi:hypothetical protein
MLNLKWLKIFQCPQAEVDFLTCTIYIQLTDIKFDASSLLGRSIDQVSSIPYLILVAPFSVDDKNTHFGTYDAV